MKVLRLLGNSCWQKILCDLELTLTLKHQHICFQMLFNFLMSFAVVFVYEIGPTQRTYNQHCGCCWPGSLASVCWGRHAFPTVYGFKHQWWRHEMETISALPNFDGFLNNIITSMHVLYIWLKVCLNRTNIYFVTLKNAHYSFNKNHAVMYHYLDASCVAGSDVTFPIMSMNMAYIFSIFSNRQIPWKYNYWSGIGKIKIA